MSTEHPAERMLRTARVQWTATIVAERDEARAEVKQLRDALNRIRLAPADTSITAIRLVADDALGRGGAR